MAAITVLGSSFDTTAGTHTVGPVSPTPGALTVILTADSGYTGVVTPTDNSGSTSYSLVVSALKNTSADILAMYVCNSFTPQAASVTYTHTATSSTGGGLIVLEITGITNYGLGAVRQSTSQANQAATGTPTPVFSKAVLTKNIVIGAVFNATNAATMTPPATPTYIEDLDTGWATPTSGFESVHVITGETRSSIPWGSTSASAFADVIAEISIEAPSGSETRNNTSQPTIHYNPTIVM